MKAICFLLILITAQVGFCQVRLIDRLKTFGSVDRWAGFTSLSPSPEKVYGESSLIFTLEWRARATVISADSYLVHDFDFTGYRLLTREEVRSRNLRAGYDYYGNKGGIALDQMSTISTVGYPLIYFPKPWVKTLYDWAGLPNFYIYWGTNEDGLGITALLNPQELKGSKIRKAIEKIVKDKGQIYLFEQSTLKNIADDCQTKMHLRVNKP